MSERARLARKKETANEVPPIVQDVLSSSGQPLNADTRDFMEPRFGHDFSQVRVHTDERAAESAQAVNALAYTVEQDVVFGAEQYAPNTEEGRRLLAHELTHVVQQTPRLVAGTSAPGEILIGDPSDRFEQAAEHTADEVMMGKLAPAQQNSTSFPSVSVQRQVNNNKPKESKPDESGLTLSLPRLGESLPRLRKTIEPPPTKLVSEDEILGPNQPESTAEARLTPGEGFRKRKTSFGLDLMGDIRTYTVTGVWRNANATPPRDTCNSFQLDFLHEPNGGIQVQPDPKHPYVAQIAGSILNLHLRRHCDDLVELSLGGQLSANVPDLSAPTASGQAQIEFHVLGQLSITASTSLGVSPHSGEPPDPRNITLGSGRIGGQMFDLNWTPITISTLVHFDDLSRKGQSSHEAVPEPDPKIIRIDINEEAVAAKVDGPEFETEIPGKGPQSNLSTRLPSIIHAAIVSMEAATYLKSNTADVNVPLGEIPLLPNFGTGLQHIVDAIIAADPDKSLYGVKKINFYIYQSGSLEQGQKQDVGQNRGSESPVKIISISPGKQ